MRIRRNILLNCKRDKSMMKAIALLLYIKHKVGISSSIRKASYNRISKVAGSSPNTIKKYLQIWLDLGLVEFTGKKGDVLIIKRIRASKDHRNYEVRRFSFKSYKNTYKSLRAFLTLTLQAQKEYVKRMVRIANDPKEGEDFKKAIKFCNRHATRNQEGRFEFKENGMSYKYIAKKIGFCVTTTQKIIKEVVKKRWIKRKLNFERVFMQGVNYRYVEGFTFTTENFGYRISANNYELSPYWYGSLLDVTF